MSSVVAALIISAPLLAAGPLLIALSGEVYGERGEGARTGYETVSPRVSAATYRLLGTLLTLSGAVSALAGAIWGVAVQALLLPPLLIASAVATIEYSRRLAIIEDLRHPPTGDKEEAVPTPSQAVKTFLTGAYAALIPIAILASLRLHTLGEDGIAVSLASLPALAGYTLYLTLTRPEAYAIPELGREAIRSLQVTIPLSLTLITAGVYLDIIGVQLFWPLLLVGLVLPIIPLLTFKT
ncbi:MAG: hypothetical protein F7C35_07600 [Desulfurococcales archaeon]|nr:hypothetical protein [Desulfurococcales archaeon]